MSESTKHLTMSKALQHTQNFLRAICYLGGTVYVNADNKFGVRHPYDEDFFKLIVMEMFRKLALSDELREFDTLAKLYMDMREIEFSPFSKEIAFAACEHEGIWYAEAQKLAQFFWDDNVDRVRRIDVSSDFYERRVISVLGIPQNMFHEMIEFGLIAIGDELTQLTKTSLPTQQILSYQSFIQAAADDDVLLMPHDELWLWTNNAPLQIRDYEHRAGFAGYFIPQTAIGSWTFPTRFLYFVNAMRENPMDNMRLLISGPDKATIGVAYQFEKGERMLEFSCNVHQDAELYIAFLKVLVDLSVLVGFRHVDGKPFCVRWREFEDAYEVPFDLALPETFGESIKTLEASLHKFGAAVMSTLVPIGLIDAIDKAWGSSIGFTAKDYVERITPAAEAYDALIGKDMGETDAADAVKVAKMTFNRDKYGQPTKIKRGKPRANRK